MMEASEPGLCDYAGRWQEPLVPLSPICCIVIWSIVNAVLIVIAGILAKKSSQMSLIQRDDVVQHLSTATSNPPFRSTVLPGCLNARALRLETGRCQEVDYIDIEF